VTAAKITGAFGEPLSLLHGPSLHADARRCSHEVTEALLDQRDAGIIAAAVEEAAAERLVQFPPRILAP
jgi:hypothetical protein